VFSTRNLWFFTSILVFSVENRVLAASEDSNTEVAAEEKGLGLKWLHSTDADGVLL
jgi:hypothetical protein